MGYFWGIDAGISSGNAWSGRRDRSSGNRFDYLYHFTFLAISCCLESICKYWLFFGFIETLSECWEIDSFRSIFWRFHVGAKSVRWRTSEERNEESKGKVNFCIHAIKLGIKRAVRLYVFLFEGFFILFWIEDRDVELELCPYSHVLGEFFEFFGIEIRCSTSDSEFSSPILCEPDLRCEMFVIEDFFDGFHFFFDSDIISPIISKRGDESCVQVFVFLRCTLSVYPLEIHCDNFSDSIFEEFLEIIELDDLKLVFVDVSMYSHRLDVLMRNKLCLCVDTIYDFVFRVVRYHSSSLQEVGFIAEKILPSLAKLLPDIGSDFRVGSDMIFSIPFQLSYFWKIDLSTFELCFLEKPLKRFILCRECWWESEHESIF